MGMTNPHEYVGVTDIGKVREHNEDYIGFDPGIGVAVVADGMGGYQAGEVASELAVECLMAHMREHHGVVRDGGTDPETGLGAESMVLLDAVLMGNQVIHRTALADTQCAGMGTTIVACLFLEDRLTVAHVGDSRLYRFRKGALEQVTTDHSLLAELVARGFYTPEEARKSLNKNLVTRALGIDGKVEVTLAEEPIVPGDIYLLCSDGLSDMVEDADIGLTISNFGANLKAAAEQLVRLANDNGGRDNISALLVRAAKPAGTGKRWLDRLTDWFG